MTSWAFSAGLAGQGGFLESSSLFSKCASVLLGLLRGGRGLWEGDTQPRAALLSHFPYWLITLCYTAVVHRLLSSVKKSSP